MFYNSLSAITLALIDDQRAAIVDRIKCKTMYERVTRRRYIDVLKARLRSM